ncbi:outer dynein arm-docking complex subunit 1 [Sceloporus undulatus]|uniref:outer dynein arm-docking complex subunit 1 n=1 Tax=Sceloporus undulatus TaxID=8520 RepID=UPI001C4D2381|nr:outer dynein arm-docking complex subunit 1 [Sceloporus undulatus]XP_042333330.1 outer dynein arm-docking complex subunit 1 [Sceloporus undulatus]XP_042333331.1 outer dynein arm-docking complex subunit 1 [Sceloporus undulatus]XP_042333332.1 outer dynein arm-docking complex subunit 1 [Sceloporus undulatus]XP_042333333.1 outer dynein arm-docking complex subunit 1 [Sceloporus undulatus]XP_042333335.1 outer dynein arm-docking complex subunit 1 [Sceloporus undulatus]XP_042333336.1 outer dynein a
MPFFKSASTVRSDSSDLDLEGLAEVELAKLQRQFRLLEGDRHAYNVESREIIRRQMAEVKRLRKENEDLLCRQAVAESRSNLKQEKAKSDTLRSLLGQRDEVEQQIMEEKKQIALLDKEIQNWQKRLADLKQIVGSGTLIQEQKNQVRKRIQTAENQLDKASKEFNSQLVVNSQLREDLEILQIEHDRFEQLYKHLESELLNARKAVGAIVSTSSAAYEARDEAQARLIQLQDKAEKDRRQHETEMKELDRLLENDRRISEFIAIKLQERAMTEEALLAKKKKDEECKRKDPEEEELESYNDVFNKVLELTGATDLDTALDRYIKVEERNFAQFNYVNEQNNQKEQLLEEIKELRREIAEVQKQDSEKEAEQLSRLRDAEAQQEEVVQEANRMEIKLKGVNKIWEQLKNAIESLFWKLQCDHSVLENILGGTTTARNENVAIYLGLIEQKTNELLAMYSFLLAEEQDRPFVEIAQLLLGQTFEYRPQLVHLRPPTTGPGHDPIAEEDQRPLTHEELKDKVMNDVLRKAATLSLKKNTQLDARTARSGSIGTKKQLPYS